MDHTGFWMAFLITLLAGLSTGIGSVISLFIREFKHQYLSIMLGFSAGVMVYVSFVELLGTAVETLGFAWGNIWLFIGVSFIFLVDALVPHNYMAERVEGTEDDRQLMSAGVFTALGIAIHNFPEGVGVLFSTLADISVGLPLAIAIAIHNIPEGIAVAMPIYYATKNRKKAFAYSFGSGLFEPLGAVFGYLVIGPFMTDQVLAATLAAVGGIMIFISFDELLPLSFKHGEEHLALVGVLGGMVVMAVSLALM